MAAQVSLVGADSWHKCTSVDERTEEIDMDTSTLHKETWIYMGRRLAETDAVRYLWLHEQASEGERHYSHHKQPVLNAAIGSRWELTVEDGNDFWFVNGENRPRFIEQLDGEEVIQWDARDRATAVTKQMLANAQKAAINGKGLRELLTPLVQEMRKVRTYQERTAIIAVVIDILYSA